jgi:hypothetical protein
MGSRFFKGLIFTCAMGGLKLGEFG